MFYLTTVTSDVRVSACHLSSKKNAKLQAEAALFSHVEGSFDPSHGYILAVARILHVAPRGVLEDSSGSDGSVLFRVKYAAAVFRPFAGEVIDALVSRVDAHGFKAALGVVDVEVPLHPHVPRCYRHVEGGAPGALGGDALVVHDGKSRRAPVHAGAKVRLRIVSVELKPAGNGVTCVGSMRALRHGGSKVLEDTDFLGVLQPV